MLLLCQIAAWYTKEVRKVEQNVIIRGTGIYLPANEVGNEYFEEHFRRLGVEVTGLMKHLNRHKRFLADRDESSLSMGYEAAKTVLTKFGLEAKDIDMIVFATDTPEYNVPTNALKLNQMLKAENAHRVYDMNCNCIGMLWAMDAIAGYMQQRRSVKRTLIIGSMHVSSVVRYKDSVAYPTFSSCINTRKYSRGREKGNLRFRVSNRFRLS